MKIFPAVVVPIYRAEFSEDDLISMRAMVKHLKNYARVAVMPNSLKGVELGHDFFTSAEYFEDYNFASVQTYNALMLSEHFYLRFNNYSHILIYQTDALVFSDQLTYWCTQPYDYIGAPWAFSWALRKPWQIDWGRYLLVRLYQTIGWRQGGKSRLLWSQLRVGNGGFSLRHVQAFLHVLSNPPAILSQYLQKGLPDYPEDFFWGIDANAQSPRIRVPPWKLALQFSVESCAERSVKFLGGKLPFGTHAWNRAERGFWMHRLALQQGSKSQAD